MPIYDDDIINGVIEFETGDTYLGNVSHRIHTIVMVHGSGAASPDTITVSNVAGDFFSITLQPGEIAVMPINGTMTMAKSFTVATEDALATTIMIIE